MDAAYYLAPDVHLCIAGRLVILLDLDHDKYYAVSQEHPAGRSVKGWPSPTPLDAQQITESADYEIRLLSQLKSQGLLVTDPALGKAATPVDAQDPKREAIKHSFNSRTPGNYSQFGRLLLAYLKASWTLKHRSIKQVIHAAGNLKASRTHSTPDCNTGRLCSLMTAFWHLRPLLYTAKDACLLDSLTLLHFLAAYGVSPQWIFAVKINPFLSHCWVQHGDLVLNDNIDNVKQFSPILIV